VLLHQAFPLVKVVVCKLDETLDAESRMVLGLGDFGERYFG
jgi:uracil phosphoribosyltransferase